MSDRRHRILIVDDDESMRVALFEALSRNGYQVSLADNGRLALEMARSARPDLVITDFKMPEMDGLELVEELQKSSGPPPVIIITGFGSVETAVRAMKLGVVDFILKPFSLETIEETVARILSSLAVAVAGRDGGLVPEGRESSDKPIIGEDPKLLRLLERARTVASSKATVLITGESGTGKELVARFIHRESNRRNAPFVAINCAALPEGLLESELFGHEKGAFTGAVSTKKGKFELADGGMLLLDEIGEIPLHLQAKLLRVLQEEAVDRVGGRMPVKVDVHVLATTNRDLQRAVEEGTFREDLFYRLNVIPLRLPPLRERREDVPLLAGFFLKKYNRLYGKEIEAISQVGLTRIMQHPWKGNVRELENLMARAVLLCTGSTLAPEDFWDEEQPAAGPGMPAPAGEVTSLREVERQMILQALKKTDNNRTHAAKMLGVSVRTLRNKLNEYRLQGQPCFPQK